MRSHHVLDAERAALVVSHLGIARSVAWKYSRRLPPGSDHEEVLSKAIEALVLLARGWDPERWPRFGAYATTVMPSRLIDLVRADLGRQGQRALPTIRLEDPMAACELDLVGAFLDLTDGPEELATRFRPEDGERLWDLVDELPARQRLVIRWRYRANFTLAMVGEMLGLTESRACQLEAAAMRTLRGAAERAELC